MKKDLILTGKIVSGAKQGAFFTKLDWFQEQCLEQLGFRPYPGTLNIKVSIGNVPIIEALEKATKIDFIPPDSTFCSGKAVPVTAQGIRAAIVLPAAEVRVHGKDIIEVIAPVGLKEVLDVEDGDSITLIVNWERSEI